MSSLDKLKNKLHQGINELFVTVAMDEMTGDDEAYRAKLADIAIIARVLGIDTEVETTTLYLTDDDFLG